MLDPCIGRMLDRCCTWDDLSMTTPFVEYVQLHHNLFCNAGRFGWTAEKIDKLKLEIADFKKLSSNVFQVYQPFSARTRELHSLYTFADDLAEVGNKHILHSGLFERARRFLTTLYKKTSNMIVSVLDEIVVLYNRITQISTHSDPFYFQLNGSEVQYNAVKLMVDFQWGLGRLGRLLMLKSSFYLSLDETNPKCGGESAYE